mmetsp:Transcript_34675/g.80922  ORF Transcript_34675/g.80922 Transcript_34675/m.80922 type:complete len:205 (-) Transcript_34675:548-1162(-)
MSLFQFHTRRHHHYLHHGRLLRLKLPETILEFDGVLLLAFRILVTRSATPLLRLCSLILLRDFILLAYERGGRVRVGQSVDLWRLYPNHIALRIMCELLLVILHLGELDCFFNLCRLPLCPNLLVSQLPGLSLLHVSEHGFLLVFLAIVHQWDELASCCRGLWRLYLLCKRLRAKSGCRPAARTRDRSNRCTRSHPPDGPSAFS